MQVFVPFKEPIKVAECLDSKRLHKQIVECKQILNAIDGKGKGWFNHPVVKMYKPYREWLYQYMLCLGYYKEFKDNLRAMTASESFSVRADEIRPPFLTEDFCIQHRKRLYTKNAEHYKQFVEYGTSEENWYFVDGSIVKYINGKRV